ncbi:MAG: GNAT family N-acetyltransferase [Colwellia sp.]|nr:GNAT family N-acetyltransferase [Colwellia sp.]
MTLVTEIISTSDEFNLLENEWEDLLVHSCQPSFFLSFHWLNTWWKFYASETDTLNIIILRNDDQIVAILPIYFNDKKIHYIGTNDVEHDEVCTEYIDIICRKGIETEVLLILEDELATLITSNKELILTNYLEHSLIYKLINNNLTRHWNIQQKSGVRYFCKLPHSIDNYHNSLSKSFTKKMKRVTKKFVEKLEGDIDKTTKTQDIEKNFSILDHLHSAHWQSKNKDGAFTSARFKNFHISLCKHLHKKDKLTLWILNSTNTPLAVIYCIDYLDTRYFYQAGINTEFKPNISPGNILHLYAIEDAIKNKKILQYDFMKGESSNSYKQMFTNQSSNMYNAHIFKKKIHNISKLFFWQLKNIRDFIK